MNNEYSLSTFVLQKKCNGQTTNGGETFVHKLFDFNQIFDLIQLFFLKN